MDFLKPHCFERQYVFGVKKCDYNICHICKPPRLPDDVFLGLHFLPDPISKDDHYLPFEEVYDKETSEKFRPSLNPEKEKDQGISFSLTAQTAKNVNQVVECECEGCGNSKKKSNQIEKVMLTSAMDVLTYSCGTSFTELNDDSDSQDSDSIYSVVYVRKN